MVPALRRDGAGASVGGVAAMPTRLAALLSAFLLAFTLVRAQPAPTPLPPLPAAELAKQIDALVQAPRFRGATWGMQVESLDSGRVLYVHEPDLRQSPASNSKLYVGALALARLGGDFRIVTPLRATGPIGADGVLAGDLVIVGRGDPSWHKRWQPQPWAAAFAPFLAELRRAGVTRIRGDVVADGTWLRSPPHGAGWTADDLNDYYGAEQSGVTFGDNYVELRVTPAAAAGAPCTVELLEPDTELQLDNRTETLAAGAKATLQVQRLPGSSVVTLFGGLPVDAAKPEVTEATVPRPAGWFARALVRELRAAGIAVEGGARSVIWPEAPVVAEVKVGEVVSPPLRDLVAAMMKPSQNLETNLLFAQVGEARRKAETPAWRRSEDLAVDALKEFLAEVGVGPDDVIFEDGSGLSRNNLITAAATVKLLRFMAGHPEGAAFYASLPVAGRDGTLRRRMIGTPAEANVHAKTGSLRWAATLSGHVTGAAGERLIFSLLLNRHVGTAERPARAELDEIAVLLSRYADPK